MNIKRPAIHEFIWDKAKPVRCPRFDLESERELEKENSKLHTLLCSLHCIACCFDSPWIGRVLRDSRVVVKDSSET
ncbi:hypothetical protein PanWU01x14_055050 [Parasponia andersonii]|uniref:Uncharacterized protein n=1 Tax=Parasponia andersonii TaxID=3476 RepID=A0A2P5DL16_PARAD|nr:hypothetical protein PanWU01x14_055050 [Parasponia andersonii]